MAKHNIIGKEGENLALSYLESKKFTILATNWRFSHLEIDIIAQQNMTVCFIEVKTRSTTFFGEPHLALTKAKQKNMLIAANHYIEEYKIDTDIRFDLISIVITGEAKTLTHYENVFNPFQF